MSQIIGKVGMTPRGMYERTRAYERLDVVTYQGSSWVAIVDVPAHISPALGSDYWQLQARMGETGPQGPVGPQGNSAFMNDGTVNKYELVNNLTQGGENAVLSAEQGKILKQELTELESKINTNVVSNNSDFNEFVKELYIPAQIDLSSVAMIRMYNGFAGLYGLKLYDNNNTMVVSITSNSPKTIIKENTSYAVLSKYPNAEYTDFEDVLLSDAVKVLDLMPIISNYITSQDVEKAKKTLPMKLEICTTYGYIDFDTEQSIAKLSANVTMRINGADITIPSGEYPYAPSVANQYFAYREHTNSASFVNKDLVRDTDHVIMVIRTTNNVLSQVVSSNIPYRINGKSLETKVESLETKTEQLEVNAEQNVILSNSAEFNAVVKELYIPSELDVSKITWARVYNGFAEYYGVIFYDANNTVVVDIRRNSKTTIIEKDSCKVCIATYPTDSYNSYDNLTINEVVHNLDLMPRIKSFINEREIRENYTFFDNLLLSPNKSHPNCQRPLIYEGDTKNNNNHIVNAVAYPNGVIIAARAGKGIVRVNLDGSEDILLTISASDWRCLWMDSKMNVFASPHDSIGMGLSMGDRGLYNLTHGSNEFVKVISLYDTSSSIATEREENDDTIWTMCEDNEGNLYAGVYSHTKHYNPAIYKSIDGGNTWDYYYNFIESGLAPKGHHVHSIIYNEFDNALYAIIGEINTLYKSIDGATTWVDVNAPCQYSKGSAMIATPTGILIGSDGAYNCAVAKYYPNGVVKTRGVASANTIFAFRKSDITGRIYAFCKIDSSVSSTYYFPPTSSAEDANIIDAWMAESEMAAEWKQYNELTKTLYLEDAVKPHHFMIMASEDDGESWYVVYREYAGSLGASGLWTTGQFRNGECLAGRIVYKEGRLKVVNPLVISDGSHRYNAQGVTIDGGIYKKIQSSDIVTAL